MTGNSKTKLITLQGAINLIMLLPGNMAKTVRTQISNTMTRFFAGDETLVNQIHANAASDDPIARLARASLAAEDDAGPAQMDDYTLVRKRRMEEIEFQTREVELTERKLANVQKSAEFIQSLKSMHNVDERTKMQMEDYTKNVLFNAAPTPLAVNPTGNMPGAVPDSTPLTISVVAYTMGLHRLSDEQQKQIGTHASNLYFQKYGTRPPKHVQSSHGKYIPVCSYTERDRHIVMEAIHAVMSEPEKHKNYNPITSYMTGDCP